MSHNKNTQALESIQELSASLFYQKIREEAEIVVASEENLAAQSNITGENNIASKEILASEKELAQNILPAKKTSPANIMANEENFTAENNIASEKILVSEKNLAQNILPGEKISLVNALAGEENLATAKNLAQNILPDKNFSPVENQSPPTSINAEVFAVPDSGSADKKKLAGKNFFVSSDISSSSNFNLTTTTTKISASEVNLGNNKSIAGDENLSGKKNIASDFFLTTTKENLKENLRRNVPVENYDSSLVQLASSMGMASFGMLIVLRSVLPQNGGVIRVNALARSIGMSANNIRVQLETLKNKGLIVTHMGGEEGRWIDFTETCLKATSNLFLASDIKLADENNLASKEILTGKENFVGGKTSGKIFVKNRFTFPLRVKEFYFTCLKAGKIPESFQPAVIKAWIDMAEIESPEYAVAVLLEFLPNAKTNPSAYLHTMLENKVKPSGASLNSAKQLLEILSGVGKTIGEEILPKDWVQIIGKLGIRTKAGSVQELTLQQTDIVARLEKFTSQLS
jgi:hypothetical protein